MVRKDWTLIAAGVACVLGASGANADDLTASVGDPNTFIPETKVFLCSLKRKVTA